MGLSELLARAATSRAHVLIAQAPGSFRARAALERALDAAGWCAAQSVADADVLAVVGEPGPELTALIDHAWEQMSEPRARVQVYVEGDVAAALAEARHVLRDTAAQRTQGAGRAAAPSSDHGGHEDHGGHGDEGGHDHGSMAPDGIPLAGGAEDRDGLEMDELHLPLGPVLAHWPAGIVLRVALHGDVVADAEVEQLDSHVAPTHEDDEATRSSRLLDAAASVLTLAGLPVEAARAKRLRDERLDGGPTNPDATQALARRLRRLRTLGWVLKGLTLARADGPPERLIDRLVALVERAGEPDEEFVAPTLESLPDLLRGQELAAVRLWMAALSVDLIRTSHAEAAHD